MVGKFKVFTLCSYIGSSTRSEIEYARQNGKTVRYLEEPDLHPSSTTDVLHADID